MRYKTKRQNLQDENLVAQEEGVAYIINQIMLLVNHWIC